MNITVIGGGNIGTLMSAEAAYKGHSVTVYTSKPHKWEKCIDVYDSNENLLIRGVMSKITDNMELALKDADYVWVTVPAQVFPIIAKKMAPYATSKQKIGIVPGFGGAEFIFRSEIEKGCTFFGLQRVHSIARLKEYGKSVYQLGRKKCLEVGVIPLGYSEEICKDMSSIFDMPCESLPNYLSVTLTPSNPIFHTSRLYSLFKDWHEGITYPRNILFHEEWNNEASEIMIACDNELQSLCRKIPLDLSSVESLQDYYESHSPEEMTSKIRSIKAFKGLKAPMIEIENRWIPDWNSRYFIADFNYGLKVIKDISDLFDVPTPTIDMLWQWYCKTTVNSDSDFFRLNFNIDEFISIYKK